MPSMGRAVPAPLSMAPLVASSPVRQLYIGATYLVHRPASLPRPATILNTRQSRSGQQEAYISFIGQDKRLDTWVPESEIGEQVMDDSASAGPSTLPLKSPGGSKRRKLAKPLSTPSRPSFAPDGSQPSSRTGKGPASAPSSPDREHAALTRVRNFDDARFGEYLIRTWYYSPYPPPPEDPSPHSSQVPKAPNGPISKKGKAVARPESPAPGQDAKSRSLAASRSIGDLLNGGSGKNGEGSRGRLWACDLCFKYMRSRAAWERHSSSCQQFLPPGRRVYQRGSYSIFEVDGAAATLYCQNLSLFGKLFIDHKSVFYHVENFLFYIMCDASTSYRDQPMAFFSKEKSSFDDYNLACIVTFPPFQGHGFGKLLIEFSYYLTKHPSTRPTNLSPGTPERPLSDLGLKGYLAYWSSTILRYLRTALASAPRLEPAGEAKPIANGFSGKRPDMTMGGRKLRDRASVAGEGKIIEVDGICMLKHDNTRHKGQYSLIMNLFALASACDLRIDDTAFTLGELGLLAHKRPVTIPAPPPKRRRADDGDEGEEEDGDPIRVGRSGDSALDQVNAGVGGEALGEWRDVGVVISREEVERLCGVWSVRDQPMLDTEYVFLD